MANDFQRPQRVKNALDNKKLTMYEACPTTTGKGKFSSLTWGLYSNNPRVTVYTNDPEDNTERNNYGKISANLDMPVFFSFLQKLQAAINAPGEFKEHVSNLNHTFFGGKRSPEPVEVSELWAGKTADGRVWISVIDKINKNRPRIQFFFKKAQYHNFIHADGTPLSDAENSVLAAQSMHNLLSQMMPILACMNYVEPPPRDNNRSGGNGYQNRGGSNQSSSYDNSSQSDDIPF